MAEKGTLEPSDYVPQDPEAFARNMARLYEEYGKALSAYVAPREHGTVRVPMADETADMARTLKQVADSWLSDPQRAVEAQTELWKGVIDLWASSVSRMFGEDTKPIAAPDPRDKRFADPDWSKNLYFDFAKQFYLLTTRWAQHLVDDARGLDPHTKHKAEFYIRQIGAAMSPSNYLMTNPELLKQTLQSNGENLVRGMHMLAEDLKAGGGDLKIRQSDGGGFEVGKNLATTPGKVVFRNDLIELLQYTPTTSDVLARPLLLIPPWINKFYILDLIPDKSFIGWLVAQGHTVFCISWVNPNETHAAKSFEDYMRDGIFAALDAIHAATGERQVNSMAYCVGGTLLAVTLAYMAATDDDRIASATLLTTQVDFTHAGDLKVFVDEEQLAILEGRMKEKGYLEGKKMASAFNMLRANDLIWPYVVNNYLKGKSPTPFDLLYWNSDSTRMTAACHSFYLRNCYLENTLSQGRMVLGGKRLDVSKVTIPIYNLATREDHIAPPQSVFLGCRFFGGPVDYVLAGSGHIAGVVNPPAKGKYQFWTGGPAVGSYDEWTRTATETPGSWWPHWHAWVTKLAPARGKPRVPGKTGKLKALGDAPGTYVKVRD